MRRVCVAAVAVLGVVLLARCAGVSQAGATTSEAKAAPPTADFTVAPSPSNSGQQVTFDWTGTCPAGPCTFEWEDEGPDGPGGTEWPWGTGDPYVRSFQVAGTKNPHLIVTDSLGRTAESRRTHQVQQAPPPPTQCSDRIDNDGDGANDYPADLGCVSAADDDETNSPPPPLPPPSGGCDRNATPTNFATQVTAAAPGQTICLATGDYGNWTGTDKAITIKRANAATPTMRYTFAAGDGNFTLDGLSGMGGTISSGASNITIKNSAFNTYAQFKGLVNSNIMFAGNSHNHINSPSGAPNARIGLGGNSSTHSGVTIKNSLLRGGDSDGVFTNVGVNVISSEFADICPSGPNHTDMIQFADPGDPSLGATGAAIRGNYFHSGTCGTQTVASYDSGTRNVLIEDNVIDTRRPWGIELYSDQGSIVRHNTLRWYPDSQCMFTGQECGRIHVTRKSADPPGSGTQVYYNVAVVGVGGGSTVARNDHNVDPEMVTFLGPLTSYAGFHLAAGSVGKGAASDGSDVGIR
jgi:hypothetical protein